MKNKLSIIVAASDNNVIGVDNSLPWHVPEDLRFFKKVTTGKPIIMGRKTHESISRSLPDRLNIVISRTMKQGDIDGLVFSSIKEALAFLDTEDYREVVVIGGASIYHETLDMVDRIYLSRIHITCEGDAFFPEIPDSFDLISRKVIETKSGTLVSFCVFERC